METIGNGKSIFEARWDIVTSWQCLEYYAGLAASMAGEPSSGPGASGGQAGEQILVGPERDLGIKAHPLTILGLALSAWVTLRIALSFPVETVFVGYHKD